VAHAKDEDVIKLDKVLKEITKDAEAFKSDPKGKVPDLKQTEADAFAKMSLTELNSLAEAGDAMTKVEGFEVTVGEASVGAVSVKMV